MSADSPRHTTGILLSDPDLRATESQIDWHGLGECGLCKRIRGVSADE